MITWLVVEQYMVEFRTGTLLVQVNMDRELMS